MRIMFCFSLLVVLAGSLAAQTKSAGNGNGPKTVFEGQPASVRLASRVTTTIRLPEPVNSVVLGDSNSFQAEYSPNEPLLVFVKTNAPVFARTNLVISTVRGRQFVLLLTSVGAPSAGNEPSADLVVTCQAAQIRFIEETFPSALISETRNLDSASYPGTINENSSVSGNESGLTLDEILDRQRRQKIERLHGDRIRVGVGEIAEDGPRLIVPFSVTSSKSEPIELLPPQIQLTGQTKSGMFQRTRWTTVQQVPVEIYRLSRRRLNPGERVDGVVVFERPAIKQSTERLMLQIADSAAVDQPTMAPISFTQAKPLEKDHD